MLREAEILLREAEILLREAEILLREAEILLREAEILLREAEVLLRRAGVLLRGAEVLLRELQPKVLVLPQANVEQPLDAADQDLYARKSRKKQPPEGTDVVLMTPVITEIKAVPATPGVSDARVPTDGTPPLPGACRYL